MNTRTLAITSAMLGLACAGCIVSPPPPPATMMLPPPPVAQAAPQQTAQAPAPAPTCREFQQTITIGGTPQAGYGTTCQQPDGTWRVVGASQPAPSSSPSAPQPQIASTSAYPYNPYPYPAYYPPYSYAPGYYTYGGVYVRGRFR